MRLTQPVVGILAKNDRPDAVWRGESESGEGVVERRIDIGSGSFGSEEVGQGVERRRNDSGREGRPPRNGDQ